MGARLRLVTREVDAPPESVWDVLSDGWFYAAWVVGASRVRSVDSTWPAPGSRIHHSFGIWPAVLNDTSEVLECDPGRTLIVRARGWPAGEAEVHVSVTPTAGSAADRKCSVGITEDVVAGPGRLVPRRLRQMLIAPRNTEALRRIALIAQGRHRGRSPQGQGIGRAALIHRHHPSDEGE